jgi:hypothetical protein
MGSGVMIYITFYNDWFRHSSHIKVIVPKILEAAGLVLFTGGLWSTSLR